MDKSKGDPMSPAASRPPGRSSAPTIRDIAEAANVSVATVSKGLNSRSGVGPKTRLLVQRTAQELGYAPYGVARQTGMLLPGGKHLAVLFGPVGSHIVGEIQRGIDPVLRSSGLFQIACYLMPGDGDAEDVKEGFLRKIKADATIAGLLAAFVDIKDSSIAALASAGVPTVFIDGPRSGSHFGNIMIDHAEASREAVQTLVKLGRRHIGYVGPRADLGWVWSRRIKGVRDAVKKHGLSLHVEDEFYSDPVRAGFATRRLLAQAPQTDGIIYGSDLQALGGLKMLAEMSVAVPDRVAVIGFDDLEFCRAACPPLSSVQLPFRRMGELGAKMILEKKKRRKPTLACRVLATRIVLRASCRTESRAKAQ